MYFEPMLPSEIPAEDVKIELDVEKFLDIIEYEESGRVELESPPWSPRPRVGFVKDVTGNVRVFFMFMSLISSARVTPESSDGVTKPFMRDFFSIIMGGDEEREEDMRGPGGCTEEEECREYCEDPENREECMQFRDRELPEDWENREVLTGEVIKE